MNASLNDQSLLNANAAAGGGNENNSNMAFSESTKEQKCFITMKKIVDGFALKGSAN